MFIEERQFSEKTIELLKEILSRVDDPNDIIDLAILLTLISYNMIVAFGDIESDKDFIDNWMKVIKYNIEKLDGD